MKHIPFLILTVLLSMITIDLIAQNEDPAKLLAFKKKDQFDKYLTEYEWKADKKNYSDSVEGEYYLYTKKSSGGGSVYMAVYPNKFIHYMVFYEARKPYSKVLSYEEFLHMPEGKSRFNSSNENKMYAIKSISFDDPKEIRNQNIFFGKTQIKEGMALAPIGNIEELTKEQIKALKRQEQEAAGKELNEEIILEEKLNEDTFPEEMQPR